MKSFYLSIDNKHIRLRKKRKRKSSNTHQPLCMLSCSFILYRTKEIESRCLWRSSSPVQLKSGLSSYTATSGRNDGYWSNNAVLLPGGKCFWVNTSFNLPKNTNSLRFIVVWLKLCIMQPVGVTATRGPSSPLSFVDNINGCASAGFWETSTVCYVKIAKHFKMICSDL